MKSMLSKLCMSALILASCQIAFAATQPAPLPPEVKIQMIEEIGRGGNEVFNCTQGLSSDKEIVDCVTKVLDENIQKETDTAPFLAGMYFDGFARLAASNPTEGVKGKWLVMCLKRVRELQIDIGFTDKELAAITHNTGILPEIEKMRLKADN